MFYTPLWKSVPSNTSFANQGSAEFKLKTRWKVSYILNVLKAGFNLLYIDSDIILLKNPFPFLNSYSRYNLIAQSDEKTICTGFIFLRSSPDTIELITRANHLVHHEDNRDQQAVNAVITQYPIPYFLLPERFFPNGMNFFDRYQYYWDRTGGRGEAV